MSVESEHGTRTPHAQARWARAHCSVCLASVVLSTMARVRWYSSSALAASPLAFRIWVGFTQRGLPLTAWPSLIAFARCLAASFSRKTSVTSCL